MTHRGLTAADAVVSPSAGYAAMVRRTYALPRLPVVVHNGREPAGRPPGEAPLLRGDSNRI